MPLRDGTYVPTLAIRASEMNGLEFLPARTKDRINPVFLLAPWANAQSLGRAMERIARAFPQRSYFLDFDRDYVPTNPDSPAQAEWLELRNPENRFNAWWVFWSKYPNVLPCLQLDDQNQIELVRQVGDVQSRAREFCVRLELNRLPRNLDVVVDALNEVGTADFTVVVEGGWVSDPMMMYVQAHGLVTGALSALDGRIPIVVSCTSMPKGFNAMEGITPVEFANRRLVEQVQRNSNRDAILYGDWGSTKPRENSFGQRPLPRIDYPTNDTWFIARNKDEEWDYSNAAQAILASNVWDGQLGIWGERMIEQTSIDPEFGIDTPQKNVAARVNIHLHRQALYGEAISGIDLDEDWVD